MFGGGIFGTFDNDPFFQDTPLRMRPPMVDPFGMFGGPRAALTGPETGPSQSNALSRRNDMMWPFAFGQSPFDSMFERFESMANDSNAHTFSSSTVMSFSSGGPDGNPQMYRATKSTRAGPGGVKETRRQVQDSVSGIQKMSVGHQIGDKSHTIGKGYNAKTNEEIETQDFVNLDEDETEMFEKEWDQKTRLYNRADMILGSSHQRRPLHQQALSSKPYHSQDYQETVSRREKKKEKHRHHREHSDDEYNGFDEVDHAVRTRPYHTHAGTDSGTRHRHHLTTDVDSGLHQQQQQHGKPVGLSASRRRDEKLQHGRSKSSGVGHRSKTKSVNFTDENDDKPVRKQPYHYSKFNGTQV